MKSETIKKINTFGKIGYIICKISKILLLTGIVICLACASLMCFVPKEAAKVELKTANTAVVTFDNAFAKIFELDTDDSIIEIGENTYKLTMNDTDEPEHITNTLYISNLKWMFFVGAFGLLVLYVAFYFAGNLCKSFKECETPFTEEISDGLMKLAYSLIGVGIVEMFAESFSTSLIMGEFLISVDINIITLLLILCVFMLSFIFKHGTTLQLQSDETL